jgi:uncharacterized RDD family membrane protein YckC
MTEPEPRPPETTPPDSAPPGSTPSMEAPVEPPPIAPEAAMSPPPVPPPPMAAEPAMPPPPVAWAPAPPVHTGPMPGLRYAGFWVRLVAWIIDVLVLGVISAALSPLAGGAIVTTTPTGTVVNTGAQELSTLVALVYFVGFWTLRAQTPGMIVFNMRVVRADNGQKIDVARAFLRYVGLIISFIVIFLGVIWVAFDSRKQGWHDKLAGTLVVRPS